MHVPLSKILLALLNVIPEFGIGIVIFPDVVMFPITSSMLLGVVVPMPTLPLNIADVAPSGSI